MHPNDTVDIPVELFDRYGRGIGSVILSVKDRYQPVWEPNEKETAEQEIRDLRNQLEELRDMLSNESARLHKKMYDINMRDMHDGWNAVRTGVEIAIENLELGNIDQAKTHMQALLNITRTDIPGIDNASIPTGTGQ